MGYRLTHYPAQIVNGVLQVAIPMRDQGPLFTEEMGKGTENLLGKRDAGVLLDELADKYYREMVLRQMTPSHEVFKQPSTPQEYAEARMAEISPVSKY